MLIGKEFGPYVVEKELEVDEDADIVMLTAHSYLDGVNDPFATPKAAFADLILTYHALDAAKWMR